MSLYSYLLGWTDSAYYLDRALRKPEPMFARSGWGDVKHVLDAYKPLLSALEDPGKTGYDVLYSSNSAHPKNGLEMTWTPKSAKRTDQARGSSCCRSRASAPLPTRALVDVMEGTFPSPCASILPANGQTGTCRVLMVVPKEASDAWRPWVGGGKRGGVAEAREIVLHFPSTGEQGYAGRQVLAESLAQSRGAVSIIVTAPLYGARKADVSDTKAGSYSIHDVGQYLAQSLAIMNEGAALLVWAHATWPHAYLASTGFSWGAAMASCAAILASAALPAGVSARQLCVVPYVGATSPAPVVDGILSNDMDWEALVRDASRAAKSMKGLEIPGLDLDTLHHAVDAAPVRAALLAILREFHNGHFLVCLRERARRHAAAAAAGGAGSVAEGSAPALFASVCSCNAENDWFLSVKYSGELHEVLAAHVSSPCRARAIHLPGGHLRAFMTREKDQIEAIHWALDAAAGKQAD